MTRPHSNSSVERGPNAVWIETGQIINVDMAHWTVDVRTKNTHRQLLDKQVCAPYLHFNQGEGIFCMPEVGAKCMVCSPSDDEPFVLCFITAFEREPSGEVSTQSEEGGDEEGQAEVTFRAGRPKLQQGDLMMRTRDGNQLWLHRGGMVEIGATHMAKRVYIPISNMIRDVFENYEARSTAGDMVWRTYRADTDPDGNARAVFSLAARSYAQDKKSSVLIEAGNVIDSDGEEGAVHLRCIVAPNNISVDTGEVTGTAVYEFDVNADGDVNVSVGGDITMQVDGTFDLTVDGDGTLTFGDLTQQINGDFSTTVSGNHTLSASRSVEDISGAKIIDSPTIKLGGSGASDKVALMTANMISFGSHTHQVLGPNTGPPSTPMIPNLSSARKVYGQ
jgi:hypothetical protein